MTISPANRPGVNASTHDKESSRSGTSIAAFGGSAGAKFILSVNGFTRHRSGIRFFQQLFRDLACQFDYSTEIGFLI
jgi:hypothetical protein